MSEILVQYEHVNICQEEHCLLNDVNFTLCKGDFVYLTGKVGSGKTSFLKTMYGELDVKTGTPIVLNYNMRTIRQKYIPALRRRLGIIFQDFQLLNDRTVYENLKFVLKATGWKKKLEIDSRINEVLSQVGMTDKGYKMPKELSGGEQQRIVIARAILNKPELILADEPTGNLDDDTGRQIIELLIKISKDNSAVILSTHKRGYLTEYPGRVLHVEEHNLKEIFNVNKELTEEKSED